MESILKKIARFIAVHHKAITFVFALLTIVAVIGALKMNINADIIDVLPHDNATVNHFKDFIKTFSLLDHVTIVIESIEGNVEEHAVLIESIAEKLQKSSLIEYVDHRPLAFKNELFLKYFPLFLDEQGIRQLRDRLTNEGIERQVKINYQKLISPLSTTMDSELAVRDPLMISQIFVESVKRRESGSPLDLSSGYYITNDHSLALIFIKPNGKSKDMAFVKKLKGELDTIIAEAVKESGTDRGVTVRLTGGHIISEEIRQIIRHDIINSSAISIVLIAALIWVVYRARLIVLAAIGLTMFTSLSVTLFVAYIAFGGLNIVTSIVAAVLIGLYVDYAMHMVNRFSYELKTFEREAALEAVFVKVGPAIVVSAVTSSFSFFSILATKFEGLYELGVISGIGILICLVSNFFLLGSLLFWLSARGTDKIAVNRGKVLTEGRLARLVTRNPRLVIYLTVLAIVFLGYGMTKLRFDSDPEHIGLRDGQASVTLKRVNEKLNRKGTPLNLMVKAKTTEDITAGYDAMEQLLKKWRSDGLIERYDSVRLFLPPPSLQKAAIEQLEALSITNLAYRGVIEPLLKNALRKDDFDYDEQYIRSYANGIEKALSHREPIGLNELDQTADPRIGHFYNSHAISIASYLYPPGKEWKQQTIDAMLMDIKAQGANWILMGEPVLFKEISSSVISGSGMATIMALLLNIGMVYLLFRKIRYVLLTMLPVTLGFLLTPGLMGYLNAPFNFINIGTIALIFGLGVDYGVYVMQAYVSEGKKGVS